eukprot:724650-Pleurochrysis_carterae.AAC.1
MKTSLSSLPGLKSAASSRSGLEPQRGGSAAWRRRRAARAVCCCYACSLRAGTVASPICAQLNELFFRQLLISGQRWNHPSPGCTFNVHKGPPACPAAIQGLAESHQRLQGSVRACSSQRVQTGHGAAAHRRAPPSAAKR